MNELAFMEYLPQILVFVGICVMLIGLVSVADPSKKLINRMSGKFTGTEKKAVNIRSGSKDTLVTKIAQVVTPKKGEKRTALREKLIRAGYRDSSTVFKYYLLRAVLAIVGLACVALFVSELSFNNMLMLGAGLALFGFSIPSYVLSKKVKARRLTIMHAFPDALDMLLICVESGLGIDSSLAKVSAELKDAHPALSEELLITCAELRAGKSRSKSLTDLATRLDVAEISAFVMVLNQSEQFGTSISQALRVFATEMRDKRMISAEEKIQKLSPKLALATAACTMPTMMIFFMAPALIFIVQWISNQ